MTSAAPAPGVTVQRVRRSATPLSLGLSDFAVGFAGVLPRGDDSRVVYVTSWTAFLNEFANGLISPFMENSHASYSIFGFFQNGGVHAFIKRITSPSTKAAVCQGKFGLIDPEPEELGGLEAKDKGFWGNDLSVTSARNSDFNDRLDLVVMLKGEVVERFNAMSFVSTDSNYFRDLLKRSGYVALQGTAISENIADYVVADTLLFDGGDDGLEDITDESYIGVNGIQAFNRIPQISAITIPGETSTAIQDGLFKYCEERTDCFPILDTPQYYEALDVKMMRLGFPTDKLNLGALVWPWLRITDPLRPRGVLRVVPPSGHFAGVAARVIGRRGIKAPAGTEANLLNVQDLDKDSAASLGTLNDVGVICLRNDPERGILVWGAKSTSNDNRYSHITDVIVSTLVAKNGYRILQDFLFEFNNPNTWIKITAQITGFLILLWDNGNGPLSGATMEDAFYVICDASNNLEGEKTINVDIGIATSTPGEFISLRLHENMQR